MSIHDPSLPHALPAPAAHATGAAAAQDPIATFRDSLRLLATRRFGVFWIASLLSNIGTWAQQVAQPWLLLSLGASSFIVGLDSFAMSAPAWLLTLAGGVLADRADRRRIITLFQSLQMLCPTLIIVLLVMHRVHPLTIVALSLVVGVTDALSMPSFSSIIPTLVRREQIGTGLALNSTQFNLSRILGPALAGVLMASVGAMACFAVSAASYVPFIAVALWILPARSRVAQGDAAGFDRQHPFAAFRQIIAVRPVRGALVTTFCTAVLCAPLITFCPVLVRSVLNGTAGQFSLTVGAFGIGGLMGGIALMAVPARRDRRALATAGAVLYGATVLAVAASNRFALLPPLLVLAGIAMSLTNTSTNTLIQSLSPASMRGEAVSLYMMAMRGGVALGSLLTGLSVTLLGVREALALNGLLAITLQLAIGRRWLGARAAASRT